MSRNEFWANQDGLNVGFGVRTGADGYLVDAGSAGLEKSGVMRIVLADLEDTDSVTAASPGFGRGNAIYLPRGSLIVDANLVTTVVVTGTGTLDIGTYDRDTSSISADVADGIDVDIVKTAFDALGETVQCDGTLVNALIQVGATSDSDVAVIAAFQTSAFTAGEAELHLKWIEPQSVDSIAN